MERKLRKLFPALGLAAAFFAFGTMANAGCVPTRSYSTLQDTWCNGPNYTIIKRERNSVVFSPLESYTIDTVGYGGCWGPPNIKTMVLDRHWQ